MNKIDQIDRQLIVLLQEDALQSSNALAKQLGTSSTTVRRRIRNLIQNGVINIQALVDPKKVGLDVAAVIACDVDPDKVPSAIDALAKCTEITWITYTTGRFDIIMMTRFRSNEDLAVFIQTHLSKLEGLKDSETFVCLQVKTEFTRHKVKSNKSA